MRRKKTVSILITTALFAVGVFGFLWIDTGGHMMQYDCPIPLAFGGNCPIFGNAIAMTWHHIAGLQNVTLSTINLGVFSLLFLSTLLLFFPFLLLPSQRPPQASFYCAQNQYVEYYYLLRQRFLRWLILCRTEASLVPTTGALSV